jgi:N-methylhydantoinase B
MTEAAGHVVKIASADAIELQVFKHLYAAVAEEMGVRLMRSAYSPNIKERRDFSCAVFDSAGQMLAQAAHIPVHLGSMPLAVGALLAAFGPDTRPGDVFAGNDPFAGGTHLPDITTVAPCFLPGESAPRFFVANRAHHSDIGGISAGSMPLSTSIEEEGLRIPAIRLDEAAVQWICRYSRTPEERRGDLQAQIAALAAGNSRLQELGAKYGPGRLELRGRELLDYTERMMRAVLSAMPDIEAVATDVLDDDGFGARDIAITCRLRISGSEACFDFTDSAEQVRGPVNAVRAVTLSAVYYVLCCLLPPDVPGNAGLMRPVRVLTRPGSIVDALPPAAVAAGNVETSQRLVDVLLAALAQIVPERIPAASCGSMNNVALGSVGGAGGTAMAGAAAAGAQASFAYYETVGGGAGAGPHGAGASGVHTHMTNTLNTPVEALEHAFPLRIEEYAIVRGTGGAGLHRGGDGLRRRYRFLAPVEATLLSERRVHPPYGLAGGQPGALGRNLLIAPDGSTMELPGKCHVRIEPGGQLEIQTPGGGGWGSAAPGVEPDGHAR